MCFPFLLSLFCAPSTKPPFTPLAHSLLVHPPSLHLGRLFILVWSIHCYNSDWQQWWSRRGHPRWCLMSFLSRNTEAVRDATGPLIMLLPLLPTLLPMPMPMPMPMPIPPRSMLGTAAPSPSFPGGLEPDGASALQPPPSHRALARVALCV